MPLELHAAILVVALAGRLGLAFRHDLHARRIDAEPGEVVRHAARAALAERDVVFLGARRVGVPDDVDALLRLLLEAGAVGVEVIALGALDRRVVEAEVDRRQRARVGGRRRRLAGRVAVRAVAVLVFLAVVVGLARRARVGRQLRGLLRDARAVGAALAGPALAVGGALLALLLDAGEVVLAVGVAAARGRLRLLGRTAGEGERSDRRSDE